MSQNPGPSILNRTSRAISRLGYVASLLVKRATLVPPNTSNEPEKTTSQTGEQWSDRWSSTVLSRDELGSVAIALAEEQNHITVKSSGAKLLRRYHQNRETLERVYKNLTDAAQAGEALTAGAEWLLDNYHVVERHVAAIKQYLPKGYYKTLPKLVDGEFAGFPRVYEIAFEFVVNTDSTVQEDSPQPLLATHFINSYQSVLELTSGELWAFPIMLRFALIENLCRLTREAEKELFSRREAFEVVDVVLGSESRTGTEIMVDLASRLNERASFFPYGALEMMKRLRARGRKAYLALQFLEEALKERGCDPVELLRAEDHNQAARQISVGNTLTSLTALDRIDWRAWFEEVNLLSQVLLKDPSRIYPKSDFATRDTLRHRIEKFAKLSKRPESEIGKLLIDLATAGAPERPKGKPTNRALKHYVGTFVEDPQSELLLEALQVPLSPLLSFNRFAKRHVVHLYLGLISFVSLFFLAYLAGLASLSEERPWVIIAVVALFLLPATEFASNIVQYFATRLVPTHPLPKLELEGELPSEFKTVVTIHTIFSSIASVEKAIDALEIRYLSNDDEDLTYVLLADLPDARTEILENDASIIAATKAGIERLNGLHKRTSVESSSNTPGASLSQEQGPFILFFRKRIWNECESRWMGWERKRGKIEEFNRYLLGDSSTTLTLHVGDPLQLRAVRYVLTLDADTQMGRGVARKLIATIAHPANEAVFDDRTGRVVSGYGLVQPRVTISLTSSTASRFAQLFSGQAGLDPYTNVVSDVYQDLFGEGSFFGKAIYDVRVFEKALEKRVPENSLLSHDLFEGLFVRVGLASDVEVYDDFPTRYMAYAKRLHRWVRGDWQLAPWLFFTVPSLKGRIRNPLSLLGYWKVIDNLRRALLPPACFLALLCGWSFLPGGPWEWTVLVLLVICFPVFTGLASAFSLPTPGLSIGVMLEGVGRDVYRATARSLCAICFLPHQATLMMHAMVVTLTRVFFTRKHLLEWEPAEQTERKARTEDRAFLGLFIPAFSLSSLGVIYAAVEKPESVPYSLPFLLLWGASPWISRWLSAPPESGTTVQSPEEERYLRNAAFDTWNFFDDLLIERYNYLMPDNLQLVPREVVAERTSPTNISLSMLSCISAYDLGFISLPRALQRIGLTVATIAKLEKYRGHLFNWYDIVSLAPLHPKYISTVDSGNFLGHLYTLETVLACSADTPLLLHQHCKEIVAQLSQLSNFRQLDAEDGSTSLAWSQITPFTSHESNNSFSLQKFFSEFTKKDSTLFSALEVLHQALPSEGALAVERVKKLLTEIHTVQEFFPDVSLAQKIVATVSEFKGENPAAELMLLIDQCTEHLVTVVGNKCSVRTIESLNQRLISLLGAAQLQIIESDRSSLEDSIKLSSSKLKEYCAGVAWISSQVKKLIAEMDFSFLYDGYRKLFTIGYNADQGKRDGSFYDLLASEARLLSFIAVARGEVPQKHWFALGRSLTNTAGGKALLSWSGTMFEYLMPCLVMKDFPSTLLGRTARAVVKAQIEYCKRQSVPWGISESAYSGVDFEKTYQYRAFGVPGLGLKRGLSYDLVVSPYSTFLALPFLSSVSEGVANLKALEKTGARGRFGFYESVDFTASRIARNQNHCTVAAFFAHHQGMSILAVNNLLNHDIMAERLHTQPFIRAAELLLHERFPERVATISPHESEAQSITRLADENSPTGLDVISSPHTLSPRVRVLSNGRYSVMLDNAGGGFSSFEKSIHLTRWREDPTVAPYGSFVYIHEKNSKKTWSAAYQPTRIEPDSFEAIFTPGRVEYKRFDDQLFIHTEITVAPEDDVELRRITVTNLSNAKRSFEFCSYMEPTLATRKADAAHPAFSKLFVRTEVLRDVDAVLCTRRPRSHTEHPIYFFHRVTLKTSYAPVIFHTSRSQFIGRGRTLQNPQAFDGIRRDSIDAESKVDPIIGLQVSVDLEPGAAETIVYISGAAHERADAVANLERYQELMHVNRAFELAWSRAQVEIRNHAYSAGQSDLFHRLAGSLYFNEPTLRGAAQAIQTNRLNQSGLWRFGISGDLPIVLVKINNPQQTKLLHEVLLAHHFLRERGTEFDVVVLHHYPGGYMQQLSEELEYAVRSSPSSAMLDKAGGVFLRSTSQVSDIEGNLLEAVARVVIDAELGSLSEVLKKTAADHTVVPAPRSVRVKPTSSRLRPPEPLLLANGLGGFSGNGSQYILPRVGTLRPPVPWANVVSHSHFGFIVTESGSGYTWSENSRENRLTSWSNDPILDPPSEAIYVRDSESGNYWSLTPNPAGEGLDYRVEHGFGYSNFETTCNDLESALTLSGSLNEKVKWYNVNLTNHSSSEKRYDLFFYADLVLGITREDSYRHVVTSFDRSAQILCAVNYYNNEFAGRVASIGCSEALSGFSGSRAEFLGRNGDLQRPLTLERGSVVPFFSGKPKTPKLSGITGAGVDPCAVIHVSILLRPREQKDLVFFLSDALNFEEARKLAPRYRSILTAKAELSATRSWWDNAVGGIQVKTPSDSLNILLNGWLLYQTLSCRLLGRSGFYQSGGAIGFRDQLQDSLALLPTQPKMVRDQILLHAAHQFTEGDVQHWWHPPTGRGVRTRITDDLLWLPYAVSRYIERTGDDSILDLEVPFLTGPILDQGQMENYFVPAQSHETGTLLEHCLRTFRATAGVGPHGLPLMGCGDWNDGMNEVGSQGKGESVWLGWFQIDVINKFLPTLDKRNLTEAAQELRNRSVEFHSAIEAHAWDGAWYRRAYYDDGTPLGSAENEECKIDSLAQSWAVISGAGQTERARQAMESGSQQLVDNNGKLIKVLTPAFDKTEKNPGYIKGYPPGIRENGGQYTHAAAWFIIATALEGRGDEAVRLFDMINPINHTTTQAGINTYKAEPYVLCGDVYSEDALCGRAGWSWYTGSSGWLYQAGIEVIIGLQSRPDGFFFKPHLPKDWGRVEINIKQAGHVFKIALLGTGNQNMSRPAEMFIDGSHSAVEIVPWNSADYKDIVTVEVKF